MKTNCFKKLLGGVLALLLCATMDIHAQQRTGGGGFGGFGGFGGGGGGGFNRTASTANSSQYNNNGTVGTANIQVDPVTHNLVIIADPITTEQIRKAMLQ